MVRYLVSCPFAANCGSRAGAGRGCLRGRRFALALWKAPRRVRGLRESGRSTALSVVAWHGSHAALSPDPLPAEMNHPMGASAHRPGAAWRGLAVRCVAGPVRHSQATEDWQPAGWPEAQRRRVRLEPFVALAEIVTFAACQSAIQPTTSRRHGGSAAMRPILWAGPSNEM